MVTAALVCLVDILLAAAAGAQEPPPAESPEGVDQWVGELEERSFDWPQYSVRRFDERYGALDPDREVDRRDFLDAFKHIDLDDQGQVWLSFGGQARLRMEGFENFSFGAPALADDGFYLLLRTMFHTELNVTDAFRVFVEGKSALVEDRDLVGGRRTLDQDSIDLQNAFAELTLDLPEGTKLLFRGGRQELLYGKQRLLSPLDWANTRRTFDGAAGALRAGRLALDAFWAKPVMVEKYDFNEPFDDTDVWGVYSTITDPLALGTSFDAYVIGKHVHVPRMPTSDRITLGGRAWGPVGDGGLAYEVEGGVQVGEVGDLDISAGFIATQLSLSMPEVPLTPWLAVGFDAASGDDDPTDGEVGTFDQLAPLGHAYLGFIDIVGRQNILDLSHSLRLTPHERVRLQLDGHAFWRAEQRDALYNAGGGVVRAGAPGTSRAVGYELDVTGKWTIDHHTDLFGGYSHFFAGDFLEDTGAHRDIDFWYLQLTFTF